MTTRFTIALLTVAAAAGHFANNHCAADENAQPFSGPQPGEKLPPLKVALAYGDQRGGVVDLIERAEGTPTLLVIVNGANRPAARLTRALMNYAEMKQPKLFAALVYLAPDRSAAQQELARAVSWWGVGPPVGVSVDGEEGPGSYGLNRNVNVTVLVANGGAVVANFALVQPSETDAARILTPVVKLTGGRPPTKWESLFLSAPTRKPAGAPWRSAPSDVRMRELMCEAIAAGDERSAEAAADALENYVAGNAERQAVLGHCAAMLLEGRTRIRNQPVVAHLRRWREQYEQQDRSKE